MTAPKRAWPDCPVCSHPAHPLPKEGLPRQHYPPGAVPPMEWACPRPDGCGGYLRVRWSYTSNAWWGQNPPDGDGPGGFDKIDVAGKPWKRWPTAKEAAQTLGTAGEAFNTELDDNDRVRL